MSKYPGYELEVALLGLVLRKKYAVLSQTSQSSHGLCTVFDLGHRSVVINYDIDPWEKKYGTWIDGYDKIDWFDSREELLAHLQPK